MMNGNELPSQPSQAHVNVLGILADHGVLQYAAPEDMVSLRLTSPEARDASYSALKRARLTLPEAPMSSSNSLKTAHFLGAFHSKLRSSDLTLQVRCGGCPHTQHGAVQLYASQARAHQQATGVWPLGPGDHEWLLQALQAAMTQQEQEQEDSAAFMTAYLKHGADKVMDQFRNMNVELELQDRRMVLVLREMLLADGQKTEGFLCVLPRLVVSSLVPTLKHLTCVELVVSIDPDKSYYNGHVVVSNAPDLLKALEEACGESLRELRMQGLEHTRELVLVLAGLKQLRVLLTDWRLALTCEARVSSELVRMSQQLQQLEVLGIGSLSGNYFPAALRFENVHTLCHYPPPPSPPPTSDPASSSSASANASASSSNRRSSNAPSGGTSSIDLCTLALFPNLKTLQGLVVDVPLARPLPDPLAILLGAVNVDVADLEVWEPLGMGEPDEGGDADPAAEVADPAAPAPVQAAAADALEDAVGAEAAAVGADAEVQLAAAQLEGVAAPNEAAAAQAELAAALNEALAAQAAVAAVADAANDAALIEAAAASDATYRSMLLNASAQSAASTVPWGFIFSAWAGSPLRDLILPQPLRAVHTAVFGVSAIGLGRRKPVADSYWEGLAAVHGQLLAAMPDLKELHVDVMSICQPNKWVCMQQFLQPLARQLRNHTHSLFVTLTGLLGDKDSTLVQEVALLRQMAEAGVGLTRLEVVGVRCSSSDVCRQGQQLMQRMEGPGAEASTACAGACAGVCACAGAGADAGVSAGVSAGAGVSADGLSDADAGSAYVTACGRRVQVFCRQRP